MLFQYSKWEWKCDIKTRGCSKVIQGDPRWSNGAKLRETIGRRGVHPLIIRGPATQSLHRCTPHNIYTNYEVFSDFSCCWNKLYKSTSSPNALATDPTFIHPLHVSVHPSWEFSFKDCDFSVSTFVHQVGKLHDRKTIHPYNIYNTYNIKLEQEPSSSIFKC